MTRAVELRELDSDELAERLAGARKELFNLRFQLATGRLDNISRIGIVRKEIARIITLEAEREAGDLVGAGAATSGRASAGGTVRGRGAAAAGAGAGANETEEV